MTRMGLLVLLTMASAVLIPSMFSARSDEAGPDTARLRRPVALALTDQGNTLLVGNRDSGTIASLDTQGLRKTGEINVGRRLADLVASADARVILAALEDAGEVVVLTRDRHTLRHVGRVRVGVSPISVRLSDDGRVATVACLWQRRLAIVDLVAVRKGERVALAFVDLPFAPRRQLLLPGGRKVVVADSFGGNVAVVDVAGRRLESVRDLRVHNIRGLALSRDGKDLLLSHQVLFALGRTTRGEIETNNLLTNNVRRLSLADVLDPRADVFRSGAVYQVGDVERGAGDPAEVAEGPRGQILVGLAGVNELGIGRPEQGAWQRLAVGSRPTALAVDAARGRAYLANTFGDSISVVDLNGPKVVAEIRLGPEPELKAEERGELLFHDARLSHDGWFSCHSCHTDGHTNGLLNDNFSDGSFGTPKRVLSLLGAKDTGPWAWQGKVATLEDQIRTSVKSTMQGAAPTEAQVRDLAAYLRTLPPPPALARARGALDAEAMLRGKKVFRQQKCSTCHPAPTYTSAKTYDVGLRDEAGATQFNPPSLRGLSQGGPYFHDNRARSLREVFTRHRHQISPDLSPRDLDDLLAFLGGL